MRNWEIGDDHSNKANLLWGEKNLHPNRWTSDFYHIDCLQYLVWNPCVVRLYVVYDAMLPWWHDAILPAMVPWWHGAMMARWLHYVWRRSSDCPASWSPGPGGAGKWLWSSSLQRYCSVSETRDITQPPPRYQHNTEKWPFGAEMICNLNIEQEAVRWGEAVCVLVGCVNYHLNRLRYQIKDNRFLFQPPIISRWQNHLEIDSAQGIYHFLYFLALYIGIVHSTDKNWKLDPWNPNQA